VIGKGFRVAALVGSRYAISGDRGALVRFISRVSSLGLVLGVALLICVLSVMNGFDRELRERILALVPHVSLQPYEEITDWRGLGNAIEAHPEVVAAAPYFDQQGLLIQRGKVVPALLHGVVAEREARITALAQYVVAGELSALDTRADAIVISRMLSDQLGVGLGESLMVMAPDVNASGQVVPRMQRLTVIAVFHSGTEVDNALALVPMALAAALAGQPGAFEGIRYQVRDLFQAPRVAAEVTQGLGFASYSIDWTRTHGNLFDAIQLSRNMVGILLFLIIAVAVFNVVSTLFLIVKDKEGDIAILRTLGASPWLIMRVFVIQGLLIGLGGVVIGGLCGVGLSWAITDAVALIEQLAGIQFLNSDVYPVSYLPADLRWADVARVCGVALLMSLLATLYPSWRAARMQPADVLRYD